MTLHPIAIILLCLFLVIGDAQTTITPSANQTSNITSILGGGASFPYSVYSVWTNTFSSRTYENVAVSYLATGSSIGIVDITNGTMLFAGSDAVLNELQYASGGDLQMLPTMAGAVAVAYNLPEADGANQNLTLSREALVGIFNGTIQTWNHPLIQATNNFKLPNATIQIVVRKDGSGTSYIFSGALSHFDANWNSTIGTSTLPNWPRQNYNGTLNAHVGEYIFAIQYSIGYMDYAEVISNQLKSATIINQAGNAVWPNDTTIESAINDYSNALASSERFTVSISDGPSSLSYPICGFTYFILHKNNWTDMEVARKTLRFVWWTYTDPFAQSIIVQNQFVPLTQTVLDKAKDILETFTANGTVLYGRSACDTGCVHGTCATDGAFHVPSDKCTCTADYYNVLKTDCSEPVKPIFILWSSNIALIFIAVSVLAALFAIISACFLWIRRNNPVVRAGSPLFCCLIAVGVLIALSSITTYMGVPTDLKCKTTPYVLSCSFGLVFGMLLAKTYRIYEIFENRTRLNKGIPDSQLLIVGGAILLAELIMVSIWIFVDPPTPNLILSGANEHIYVCSSQSWSFQLGMMSTLYVGNGLLLAVCLFLAFKTRKVRGPFKETHMITFTVYGLAVSFIVILPVMYLPAIDLYTQFALRTAIILACCVIVTGFLLWSKIALILFPKATDRNDPTRGFEILTALGHNDHVIRSVLGSKSGSESRRHEPVRVIEIEKITSSRWSFDVKKVKPFSLWKHVQIVLLNEYDLLLILKHQSAVVCIGAHKISACDIQFNENDLTKELQFVLKTPECKYNVESKTKQNLDEFMRVFPGQVQGQFRPKARNENTSVTNLLEADPTISPHQSAEIPAASIAPSSPTLIPDSPTDSNRSTAPPAWSPYVNTDQEEEAPHFPMCVTNAVNEKQSRVPTPPTTLSKPELTHSPQTNSAVPPPRPARSAMRSPSETSFAPLPPR